MEAGTEIIKVEPHPASWAALNAQLAQETAARKLAEALHEKKHAELELARKRIVRLEALVLGVHLEQGEDGTDLDIACMELEAEGQRIHGCIGKECLGGDF